MPKIKKKLLIVNNNLATGGVQRSLVNLLREIDNIYDVTLFVFSNSGEYKNSIPSRVKVIEASPLLSLLGISQVQTRNMSLMLYIIRAILALYTIMFSNNIPIHLLVSSQQKLLGFDVAISFLHNAGEKSFYGGCNEFVLHRVEAKQKITFLHCDFLNYGGNSIQNYKIYERFDQIAAVSEGSRRSFIKAFPDLAPKTYCVYNCHNYLEYIVKANDNPVEYSKDCLNIITVARLSSGKGILRVIDIISKIVQKGHRLCWHIIGDGSERKIIEAVIDRSCASEYIFLHGNKENPYRYMKNADVLLLPSFHEAAPIVINEAKCLGLPVITTNTTSASEMVLDRKEGFICENTARGIYESLRNIIRYPQWLLECKEYLQKQQYTNETALLQFHCLINESMNNERNFI